MENFYPLSFFQAVGGVLCISALVFSFISLFENSRTHAIRILAIFLVVALALFANHVTVYFASVFIIATAVTELEFLQTLAAILRGNKEYFAYKKETLSDEAKYKSSKAELVELGALPVVAANDSGGKSEEESPSVSPVSDEKENTGDQKGADIDSPADASSELGAAEREEKYSSHNKYPSPSSKHYHVRDLNESPAAYKNHKKDEMRLAVQRVIGLESKAIDYVQGIYGTIVERNVVYRSKDLDLVLELDGLITRPNTIGYIDQIFEVKYLSAPSKLEALISQLPRVAVKSHQYRQITKRQASLQLVVVLDYEHGLSEGELELLRVGISKWDIDGFVVVTAKELGARNSTQE
ncbi:hypothetical protein [Pseudomonas sp. PDM04]|uniref:hypothetical protein n=1 Tax=Pseudomonas sp. PDM04 TaxID=2769296 RepID=UPI00177CA7C4|nr:hypothetical protein [Pseudomonas sp. PDM04]MBD9439055.1 hypothetical protein [Pseudomonas sp. PDM04]